MKPISTDFTLTMPSELAPLSASSSCTFTIKVYTVNRQNHYSMSFSGVPATVRVASQSMMSMDTGVVNFDWFVSEADTSMPDGTYDTEGHCTSDFFWVKRPTDDLLDSLTERVSNAENEASAAFEYASSAYTFADEALDTANSALGAASAASDELDAFEGEMYTALATKHDTTAFTAFVENSAVTKGNFEETMTDTRSWEKLRDEVGTKQDTLIAGSGISIENNVISVTGSTPASGYVTTGEFNSFVESSAVTKNNFNTVLEASQGWGAHNTAITSLSGNVSTLSGQVSGKQDTLIAGSGISIENNVISVTGGTPTSGLVTTEELEESELVTAAALNDLNTRVETLEEGGGGSTGLAANIVECTQAEYEAMSEHAVDTIYVISDAELAYYTATEVDGELAPINNSITGLSSDIDAIETTIGDINDALDAINGDNNS